MFRPRIIPCLLLKENGLVKTTRFSNPVYIGDPINTVRIFNDFEADELVFLDIEATRKGRISFDLFKKVSEEAFMPFAVGGGIKTIRDIRKLFSIGADKVIINNSFFQNPNLIREASEIFGSQSIVVSLDVSKKDGIYYAYSSSGQMNTGIEAISASKKAEEFGAGELIINSIDRDGTLEGYDLDLIREVSDSVNIPVVALGGASELNDLSKAVKAGASAASAGSLFIYSGRSKGVLINYPDRDELNEIFGDIFK